MQNFFRQYRISIRRFLLTLVSMGAILLVTFFASGLGSIATAATVAFLFLVIITLSAFFGTLLVSVIVSFVAALCFDYFFLPPFGTLDVSSLGDWISLGVFLLISVIISNLTSSAAQMKENNRNLTSAMGHLADLGRWLISVKNDDLDLAAIAEETARLFLFEYCSFHVYRYGKWDHSFGSAHTTMAQQVENLVRKIEQPLDWTVMVTESDLGVRYVPIKNRDDAFAILAVKDEQATPETLKTIAYLVGARLAAT